MCRRHTTSSQVQMNIIQSQSKQHSVPATTSILYIVHILYIYKCILYTYIIYMVQRRPPPPPPVDGSWFPPPCGVGNGGVVVVVVVVVVVEVVVVVVIW